MTPVDVIILSWDRIDDTIEAIQSAVDQQGVNIQVQVVDQGSNKDDLQRLLEYCDTQPRVTIHCNQKNNGVSGGRNQATRMGTAEYVIALDNDAVFADDHVCARAAEVMDSDPRLGSLAFGVHVYETGEENPIPDKSSWVYNELDPDVYFQQSFPAKKFVGAGHLLRRSAFELVGEYDDRLFFMHEEQDICDRLTNAGYRIRHCGDMAVRHKVSPEHRVRWKSGRYQFHLRNAIYLLVKQNHSVKWAMTELAIMTWGGLRGGFVEGSLRGFFGALKLLPAALHERKHNPYTRRTHAGREVLAEVDAWLEGRRLPEQERDTATGLKRLSNRFRQGVDYVKEIAGTAQA